MMLKAKKYRCPWCGEKTFSYFDLTFVGPYGKRYRHMHTPMDRNENNRKRRSLCPRCKNASTLIVKGSSNKLFSTIQTVIEIIALLVYAGFFVSLIFESIAVGEVLKRVESSFSIPFLVVVTVLLFLSMLLPKSTTPARYNVDREEMIIPKVDLTVRVDENNKKITPWGVYGLAIENAEADLHKIFDDGLIPAIFHPTSEGVLVYNVTLIGKDKLPEDLINKNKLVKLEDNGNFFATGVINTVIEDQNN